MSDTQPVAVERRGPVTILTLDRPERLNALSHGLLRRLGEVLDDLLYDYEQRVVVLAGAGRAFCAGMDLKGQAEGARWVEDVGRVQTTYAIQEVVARVVAGLREIPQPVVAAVHGIAAGGGLSLACAADVRVAGPAARFSASFAKLGVSGGDMGSSWFLPRLVGAERAAEILLTGCDVDAAEAERIGLVSRVVAEGDELDAAVEVAQRMCDVAPFTTRMTKSLLNASRDGLSLRQQLELENRTQVMMTSTADFREACDAFLERRPAVFEDR
ncbi:enoyl-CoA hydratase/isomerase family protein [Nocardioides zeae]|uniref:Enoyl-CoA hydratase/isomerase family protein n=1 Tax=Nocardioides imazamoxiresistens TaxID=3231893 RepID=A0ABU3PQZ0_9ACTN|nr:enoyl-CoA hydratase/isomerase family protein [Nocardioides zeae]MDT9591649.1 enoyl-CoA hydratase/isomerase family protein [Nocardioides zeae]